VVRDGGGRIVGSEPVREDLAVSLVSDGLEVAGVDEFLLYIVDGGLDNSVGESISISPFLSVLCLPWSPISASSPIASVADLFLTGSLLDPLPLPLPFLLPPLILGRAVSDTRAS
jgi:hypothetical protein